jgi:putative addiction module component (TIGR02574 family)
MTLREFIDEASRLSPAERAELLDELIRLEGPDDSPPELTPAQQEDLDRRIAEYRSGNAIMIPGDEAIARLRKR